MRARICAGLLEHSPSSLKLARRGFLQKMGWLSATMVGAPWLNSSHAADFLEDVTFADGPRELVLYPQKRPLIRVTTRPPHLETPFEVFNHGPITPNDAFFVRYHLANVPLSIDAAAYRLEVKGTVDRILSLSLTDLKSLGEPIEVVAVNQCSGNSRGFSNPRVFGAQLANGAMGNARWVGVPLKTVLNKAGVRPGSRHVVFNGLDGPILPSTPDFRKSLAIEHAMTADVLLAWEMNGEAIPMLNGYPLKLIVPGYFGTYWVKHLSDIEVIDAEQYVGHDAFFMTTAYRLPDNDCECVAPGTAAAQSKPISLLPVRSFVTSLADGAQLPASRTLELKGIAFDGGGGIAKVDVSIDGGKTWRSATLGEDLGRYSFREWRFPLNFGGRRGDAVIMVRAANRLGEVQPVEASWNPAGYRRHVIERYRVSVA